MSNGRWLSETSDDVGDREPVNVRHYTLYFRFVKVQLSSFVTLFFIDASVVPFIPDETASTDAILARAGEFEGLNLVRFDVAVNAPATNSRKSCGVMNAYKLRVSFTEATPNSLAEKR